MKQKISLFSLSILMISAIDNVKNMPAAALFGSQLVFFFLFAALFFLIPTALLAAELSAAFPEKGGVYHWVEKAFGPRWAFTAVWLQWINTMVWYPTMLSFIVGTLVYLACPELAENKALLISSILAIFWGLTWVNLKGIHTSAKITNICSIAGTILPMALLIILGGIWVMQGREIQISLKMADMIPSLGSSESWVSLIAIMASFLGMELTGVHVNDVDNPRKNFPRAVFLAVLFIFLSMCLSSLSIAVVLPQEEINLVSGVVQVFSNFFTVFGLSELTPFVGLALVVGSIGTMINWVISPAKGLLHGAECGFLPSFFTKKNKAGVASNILVAQAVVVSLFSILFLFEPSINGSFWFLTALSTELYMGMYILLFCAGLKLHYTHPDRQAAFKIPGGTLGIWLAFLFGLGGSIATIVVTFISPEKVDIGNSFHYLLMIVIGNIVTISPLLLMIGSRRFKVPLENPVG